MPSLVGSLLRIVKIQTGDRRGHGKDGLPGSDMATGIPPMIQRGQDILCPSHDWEQVCSEGKLESYHEERHPWISRTNTYGIPKGVAPSALPEQANSECGLGGQGYCPALSLGQMWAVGCREVGPRVYPLLFSLLQGCS